MGKYSRDKGSRFEREFAKATGGYRVPLSGAMGGEYTGDVKAFGLTFECKVRKDGFKNLYDWIKRVDALAIKADRKKPLIITPMDTYVRSEGKRVALENDIATHKDMIKALKKEIVEYKKKCAHLQSRIDDLEEVLYKQYDPLSYGDRLQKIRTLRDKSVEQVAQRVRVPIDVVHDWENNIGRPTLEELIIIAKFLNTSTRYIELGLIEPGEARTERRGA
jgi:DNA-binding transcriptional regulator YiaG